MFTVKEYEKYYATAVMAFKLGIQNSVRQYKISPV